MNLSAPASVERHASRRVEAFVRHSDLRSCLALVRDWGAVVALMLLASWSGTWWTVVLCVIGIGVMQFAIGEALLHEASHYNVFRRNRRLNDWAGAMCALPFFTTIRDWRAEHLQHHQRFGSSDDHIAQDYARQDLTGPSPRVAWVWFGKPLAGLTTVRYLSGLGEINSVRGWMHVAVFWMFIVVLCGLAGVLQEVALYWVLPQLTIFATLLHWSEIADHYRTRSGSRSRTGRFHNWLFHNNGYHAVHHRFPVIPFHQLPAAHHALGEEPADVTRGWWGAWRQISRPPETVPARWSAFWPARSERR
jgi:fatty acid desaturase